LSEKSLTKIRKIIETEAKGIIPRVLDYLFEKKSKGFDIYISFLEIYND
jgi:hypothetical protein